MVYPGKPKSLSTNLCFLFLLLSTNLLTFFLSSTLYASCSLRVRVPTSSSSDTVAPKTNATDATSVQDYSLSELISQPTSKPDEFLSFLSGQSLPLGFNTNFGSNTIYSAVGRACTLFSDELRQYMSYKVNGSCPDDELLSQKLLLRGCEPLPRRRCRPAASPQYTEPYPLPTSLWRTPPDSSVVWTAYACKNYTCLINRKRKQKGFDDCKDCFDLEGRERTRWTSNRSEDGLDFAIDEVLAARKPGTIRIGLDIGGGVATFAVRMMERNITIVTTSMNLNGPFNTFIASRGVIPLYVSISQRLPFFDSTLDIVHSMHLLSNWIPRTMLHFLMYDIYRVLRPGGLFWLDHFFCAGEQLEEIYAPLIGSVGFNKLKWVVGRKLDRGPELREMYLSALLEKPLNNSSFLAQFFSPTKIGKMRNDIALFMQLDSKSLYDAWERYKDLLRRCPDHGFPKWLQVQIFYNELISPIRTTIDFATKRALMAESIDKPYDLLEEMASNNYQWLFEISVLKRVVGIHEMDAINALTAQVAALAKKFDTLMVHSI
ncbi:uncharacterized protein LOC110427025 [Herrania umbratica]|uniref:Uncharacterized protein LOC110427025 n=1 Tax=Herrania umbratica TaxID=108875 RepID=A0A6J1BEV5_9ROSI|nr:uncharacterized protein LOC110427025 [Herrania umbratica]